MEVDGRNGSDGIHTQAFRVGSQLLRVGGVVAGNVGDDCQLALGFRHDVLQHDLALFLALVDALAGGAANVQALDALVDEPAGQRPDALGVNLALGVITGIKRGNNALVFCNVLHISFSLINGFSP